MPPGQHPLPFDKIKADSAHAPDAAKPLRVLKPGSLGHGTNFARAARTRRVVRRLRRAEADLRRVGLDKAKPTRNLQPSVARPKSGLRKHSQPLLIFIDSSRGHRLILQEQPRALSRVNSLGFPCTVC